MVLSTPKNSISDLSDTSQPPKSNLFIKLVQISPPPTTLRSATTTPPRPSGTTTLPSSARTPRWTLSPPHSAHQKLQPSHHFQTSHGLQQHTLVTSSKPPSKMPTSNLTQVSGALPPNQPPTNSGPPSIPPNPSVDGEPGPPRS